MGMMIIYGALSFLIELLLVLFLAREVSKSIVSLILLVLGMLMFNISNGLLIWGIVLTLKVLVLYIILFLDKRLNKK